MIDEPPDPRSRTAKAVVAIGIVLAMIAGLTVRSCEEGHAESPAESRDGTAAPSKGS